VIASIALRWPSSVLPDAMAVNNGLAVYGSAASISRSMAST
jgi:hypothetical protein